MSRPGNTEPLVAEPPTPPGPRPHVATIQVSRRALTELLDHTSTAARIVGHLDERIMSPDIERLAAHIDAMAHTLGGLLHAAPIAPAPAVSPAAAPARRPVQQPAEVSADALTQALADALEAAPASALEALPLDRFRLDMTRADALASAADEQYSRLATDDARGRARHAHLVELVALHVRDVVESGEVLLSALESLCEATGAKR